MKNITLVRHAKSSWKYDVIDHERPLNDRGFNDAHLLSKHLITDVITPDLVLSSDALRAKTTANIFIENLNIDREIIDFNYALYDFSGSNLLSVIKNCEDSVNNLLIFGHNHAITDFVNTYGSKYIDNVPTCGVVSIEFNTNNWEHIENGKTLKTLFPRDLKK